MLAAFIVSHIPSSSSPDTSPQPDEESIIMFSSVVMFASLQPLHTVQEAPTQDTPPLPLPLLLPPRTALKHLGAGRLCPTECTAHHEVSVSMTWLITILIKQCLTGSVNYYLLT